MKLKQARLVFANLRDDPGRSGIVFGASIILSACLVAILFIMLGTRQTVIQVRNRMGADVLVVGQGNQRVVEDALLSGHPTSVWLERSVLDEVRRMPGVSAASPQLFLSTMRGASCCTVSDMFMIAYEPETDFTVTPWLREELGRELALGETIGGRYIQVPQGQDKILIYGYEIDLAGNLDSSGSGLDQSMFFTFDTALEIARLSSMQAEKELVIKPDSISAILVRAAPGWDPAALAKQIESRLPKVQATPREQIFSSQVASARKIEENLLSLLGVLWLIGLVCIAAATVLSVTQRRQAIGVLRSMGGSMRAVHGLLVREGLTLAVGGALFGSLLGMAFILLFRTFIMQRLGLPLYIFTPFVNLALVIAVILAVAVSACLAAMIPISRILKKDPDSLLKDG